jgi:hypothetical protein
MLSFEWKALHPGDAVFVHDDTDRAFALREGTVMIVQTRPSGNDIAIQVTGPNDERVLVHPRQSAVHLSPFSGTEPCWRCDASRPHNTPSQAAAEAIKKLVARPVPKRHPD